MDKIEIEKLSDNILTKYETPKCTCGGFPECICNYREENGTKENGKNYFTRKEAISAMVELANIFSLAKTIPYNEAVEFAEWLAEKASSTLQKDKWLDEMCMEKSTTELYIIFKAEKENG